MHPVYYGLMTFAQAAPAGSRLLRTTAPGGGLKVWATKAPDGHVRIVLINKNLGRSRAIAVRGPAGASATLELLRAPGIAAKLGITLGGQGFGATTTTGILPAPTSATTVRATNGSYLIELPPASAALLTL